MNHSTVIRFAGIAGFLGVGLGAFGAHGLHDLLVRNERLETWETAVLYHLTHAVALLVVGFSSAPSRAACLAFLTGIVLFSGSLYALSLTDFSKLGAITPLGGVAFLAGWGILIFGPGRRGDGKPMERRASE